MVLSSGNYRLIDKDGNPGDVVYEPYPDQVGQEGGFGLVYHVRIVEPNGEWRDGAIKIYRSKSAADREETGIKAIHELFQTRRDKMAGIVEPLSDKPFQVQDDTGDSHWAMSFVPWITDNTLEDLIKTRVSLREKPEDRIRWACRIMTRILNRFVGLRKLNVLYRDWHVGNLTWDDDEETLWLFDYSLTRTDPQEHGCTMIGEPGGYPGRSMDPRHKEATPEQSECYALGNIFHSLLTGEPTPGKDPDTPEKRQLWLEQAGVPQSLAEWVALMTSLRLDDQGRSERPESCQAARRLFRKAKRNIRKQTPKPPVVKERKKGKALLWMGRIAAVGIIAMVVAIGTLGEPRIFNCIKTQIATIIQKVIGDGQVAPPGPDDIIVAPSKDKTDRRTAQAGKGLDRLLSDIGKTFDKFFSRFNDRRGGNAGAGDAAKWADFFDPEGILQRPRPPTESDIPPGEMRKRRVEVTVIRGEPQIIPYVPSLITHDVLRKETRIIVE